MPGAGCMHSQQVDSQPGTGGDLVCLQLMGEHLKKHCWVAEIRSELRPCAVYLHNLRQEVEPASGRHEQLSEVGLTLPAPAAGHSQQDAK